MEKKIGITIKQTVMNGKAINLHESKIQGTTRYRVTVTDPMDYLKVFGQTFLIKTLKEAIKSYNFTIKSLK